MGLQKGDGVVVEVFVFEPNTAAGDCGALVQCKKKKKVGREEGKEQKEKNSKHHPPPPKKGKKRKMHTPMGDANQSPVRCPPSILDTPPNVIALDDGEGVQFKLLADGITARVL